MGPSPWRRVGITSVAALSVLLVAGVGTYLSRTTNEARETVLRDFTQRVRTAAAVSASTLVASDDRNRATAAQFLAGTPAQMAKVRADQFGAAWWMVLDAAGRPLGSDSPTALADAASYAANPGFAAAKASGKLAFGNLRTDGDTIVAPMIQPYAVGSTTRYVIFPLPAAGLAAIVEGPIRMTATTTYIIDSTGKIVAGAGTLGAALPDRTLTAALASASTGNAGADAYTSYPIANSSYRMVMTDSRTDLLASVQSTERAAWWTFGGFAVAMTLMLGIGAAAVVSSARLARARMYDALTGLPNRALFLERADAAIAERRRRDHDVAVLFLDLDGFKPVNDTYGHAAGDELLRVVARRLARAIRTEDLASRFGGDEFLVLCRGLTADEPATVIAERVRAAISEPIELEDGVIVSVGVSVGIAGLASLGEENVPAATLIHHADLALYHAKEGGRGRVETYAPAAAP